MDNLDLPTTDQPSTYKMRHTPTGLFYRPNNGFMGLVKKTPNLSKRGKSYKKKPLFDYFFNESGIKEPFIPEEWEFVKVSK